MESMMWFLAADKVSLLSDSIIFTYRKMYKLKSTF